MDLENWEKQRIKLYKQQLRNEMQKHQKTKKQEKNYRNQADRSEVNQMIEYLNNSDLSRLEDRRNTQLKLIAHNAELSQMKNQYNQDQQNQGVSFVDDLLNVDFRRTKKLNEDNRSQKQQNYQQKEIKKIYDNYERQIERSKQHQHLKRMKQMSEESEKNYHAILRKHSQNMNLYNQHQDLMRQNDDYRKTIEKFTETDKDVLNHLWRNQQQSRKNRNKYVQEELKKQISQFNQRKSVEKSHILKGDVLEKSMLSSMLHDDSYDKKKYGEILKSQMVEHQNKKNTEDKSIKERYHVKGIYGGEHTSERKKQIQYIDRKLGILPPQNQQQPRTRISLSINNTQESDHPKKNNKSVDRTQLKSEPANQKQLIQSPIRSPSIQSQKPISTPRLFRSFDLLSNNPKYYNAPGIGSNR